VSKPGRPPEEQAFAIGAMVAVSSILVHCWFDFNLHIPANALLLAIIMGFTAALEAGPGRLQRRLMSPVQRYALVAAVLVLTGVGAGCFVPTALAVRYTDLGNRLKNLLDYDDALAYYERAIALDPKSPEAHARMGDVYRSWANWRLGPEKQAERRALALQAVEAYARSLKLNPYQSFVRLDKARSHEMAGENAQAVESFERAIAVYPSNALAYFLLGCYYRTTATRTSLRCLYQIAKAQLRARGRTQFIRDRAAALNRPSLPL